MRDIESERTRRAGRPGLWNTLGFELRTFEPGHAVVGWEASDAYGFPTAGGYVIQGGLVTAILDAGMGAVAWTVLDDDEAYLTADLRVEFLRSARPGQLVATGSVVRRTRRVLFCAAELHDGDGLLLAAARATQVLLPADGPAGRVGR